MRWQQIDPLVVRGHVQDGLRRLGYPGEALQDVTRQGLVGYGYAHGLSFASMAPPYGGIAWGTERADNGEVMAAFVGLLIRRGHDDCHVMVDGEETAFQVELEAWDDFVAEEAIDLAFLENVMVIAPDVRVIAIVSHHEHMQILAAREDASATWASLRQVVVHGRALA